MQEGILGSVSGGIGGGKRHGNYEIGTGKAQQAQDQQLAPPARQQIFQQAQSNPGRHRERLATIM